MSLSTIRKRLDRIQASGNFKEYETILEYIEQGKCYNDLTEAEKALYCEYIGENKEVFEAGLRLKTRLAEEIEGRPPEQYRLEKKEPPEDPLPIAESERRLKHLLKEC